MTDTNSLINVATFPTINNFAMSATDGLDFNVAFYDYYLMT